MLYFGIAFHVWPWINAILKPETNEFKRKIMFDISSTDRAREGKKSNPFVCRWITERRREKKPSNELCYKLNLWPIVGTPVQK